MTRWPMKDGIQQRSVKTRDGKCSWLIFLGWKRDEHGKRHQVGEKFYGKERDAKARRDELRTKRRSGDFVERSTETVEELLERWFEMVKLTKRHRTQKLYRQILDQHILPDIGMLRVQALTGEQLTKMYIARSKTLSPSTVRLHHTIIRAALRWAVSRRLLTRDVSADAVVPKQRITETGEVLAPPDEPLRVWTEEQANRFLAAADAEDADASKRLGLPTTQLGTIFRVFLRCGLRRGEAFGLKWDDFDADAGTLKIVRQLIMPGPNNEPYTFGPPKTGKREPLRLGKKTIEALVQHRASQNRLKLRNKRRYTDLGLIFAREYRDLMDHSDRLGLPIRANNIGYREFKRLVKTAKVPEIRIHDLRHTCASILLKTEPMHVVQKRLGHSDIHTTMSVYAHCYSDQSTAAAERMDEAVG